MRIMVIGCGGSGKSTFSTQLHEITGIELIHLDQHYWKPNWEESSKEEWIDKVIELSDKEAWIMDGNYGGTMNIRMEKADTIIFMDRSRWVCLYRVLKRVFRNYGRTRKDMGAGCKEKFSWVFMVYVFHYNDTRRPKILRQLKRLKASKKVVILPSDRAVAEYLKEIRERYIHMK